MGFAVQRNQGLLATTDFGCVDIAEVRAFRIQVGLVLNHAKPRTIHIIEYGVRLTVQIFFCLLLSFKRKRFDAFYLAKNRIAAPGITGKLQGMAVIGGDDNQCVVTGRFVLGRLHRFSKLDGFQ